MKDTGNKGTLSGKRVTMEDVARHCNVSKATVSRVLSGRSNEFSVSETMIQRVKSAAKQLNYSPDRKRPGKRVTMEDIARYCGVSKTTVSRVLSGRFKESPVSGELVQRVKEAAEPESQRYVDRQIAQDHGHQEKRRHPVASGDSQSPVERSQAKDDQQGINQAAHYPGGAYPDHLLHSHRDPDLGIDLRNDGGQVKQEYPAVVLEEGESGKDEEPQPEDHGSLKSQHGHVP